MARSGIPAYDAILSVGQSLQELPAHIAGSSLAAMKYALIPDTTVDNQSYNDVDAFMATGEALIAGATRLLNNGYILDDRYSRVYHRWLKYGFKDWHTNSLPLMHEDTELEVNLIYKLDGGQPVRSLAQVIESFDFGILHTGFDCEAMEWKNMQSYLFPQHSQSYYGPLPMMPGRRDTWVQGFISQYQGLRQPGRYMKFVDYGYDMSLVKPDLVLGYRAADAYLSERTDHPDKVALGTIFGRIAEAIATEEHDPLRELTADIVYLDDLDVIMDALS